MHNLEVYRMNKDAANFFQLPIKREWMDETFDNHAYRCFPISLANGLGFGISFPEDISFVWDGITDTSPNHIKILKGEKYCSLGRGNATISFNTNLLIRTDENVTMLHMPVPNLFIEGVSPYTTLISTSFFNSPFPCAWRITTPYKVITIKAGTPIIALLPISLESINNSCANLQDIKNYKSNNMPSDIKKVRIKEKNKGLWTDFYRDAVDPDGRKIGKHETKSIKMFVKEKINE